MLPGADGYTLTDSYTLTDFGPIVEVPNVFTMTMVLAMMSVMIRIPPPHAAEVMKAAQARVNEAHDQILYCS